MKKKSNLHPSKLCSFTKHIQNHAIQQISLSCYKQGGIKTHNNSIYKRKINIVPGISKAENDSIKFLLVENALDKIPKTHSCISHTVSLKKSQGKHHKILYKRCTGVCFTLFWLKRLLFKTILWFKMSLTSNSHLSEHFSCQWDVGVRLELLFCPGCCCFNTPCVCK